MDDIIRDCKARASFQVFVLLRILLSLSSAGFSAMRRILAAATRACSKAPRSWLRLDTSVLEISSRREVLRTEMSQRTAEHICRRSLDA